MSKKLLENASPGKLFKPTFHRGERQSSAYINKPEDREYKYSDFASTNLYSTSSYRYGDKDYLVSTQQANVDYSKFENHTFFHSAVANTNEAFDRIVNFYPFDGTQKEIEEFEDTLTGFEKYVLDSFPKNVGYLILSGTQKDEDGANGNYIEVIDRAGAQVASISSNRSGASVLDPKTGGFTIELFFDVPKQLNDNQVIFQKKGSLSNNITLAVSHSNSATGGGFGNELSASIVFGITSGSRSSYVTGTIYKGTFSHIAATYDPSGDQRTKLIIDDRVYSSSFATIFPNLHYNASSIFIGSGSQVRLDGKIFVPEQTLSGSIDTVRFYHATRDKQTVLAEKRKDIYASEDLKLQYRFNEPVGTYTGNNLVLDSSGNSLHSKIENFDVNFNRVTGSNNPTGNELTKRHPVLFPDFPQVAELNTNLLTTGSEYDIYNPNLITKLIPPHYFEEANYLDNFEEDLGKLGSAFSTFTDFKVGKKESDLPGTSVLVKFLLIWAKAFDEMKIIIDTMSNFHHVKYQDTETVPDPLLMKKAQADNIILPSLFRSAEQAQLIEGVNLGDGYTNSVTSLNDLQNLIWRRILSDTTNLRKTRGTVDSIKSVFRSAGIEPDNILTFREYGGSKNKSIEGSRERKVDVYKFLNFSGSLEKSVSTIDSLGYPTNYPKLKSAFLSGSRTQAGKPTISSAKSTGTVTLNNTSIANFYNTVIRMTDGAGVEKRYILQNTSTSNTGNVVSLDPGSGAVNHVIVGVQGLTYETAVAQIVAAISSVNGHNGTIIAVDNGSGVVGLTQASPGISGNIAIITQHQYTDSGAQTWASYGIGANTGFTGGTGFIYPGHSLYGPHGISMSKSDGLFTSGSFTLEGLFDWEHGYSGYPESVIRLHTTGSAAVPAKEAVIANLVASSGSLDLFLRESPTGGVRHLFMTGANVFDKDIWYLSFGRRAPHDQELKTSRYEYFLRASKQEGGRLIESFSTSSHYPSDSASVFSNFTTTDNSSGSFIVIGQQTFQNGGSSKYLNDTSAAVDGLARSSSFTGLVSNIRFYSKNTTDKEWKARAKNLVSVGTENPLVNYNFTNNKTGSFERLILNTSGKQYTTGSNADGVITFFDFSQNNLHLVGSNFEPNKTVFRALKSDYEILSDKFDLNYAKTKIRVRSFQDPELIEDANYASVAPIYEVRPSEEVVDDNRFSIDMSVMKGLNENILTMFANFEPLENAIGRPNMIFGASYPELQNFREIYFNNVLEKMDLSKYRSLFKWIDNAFTDLVYSMVPRSTTFMGINFIYESHVLERNRLQYTFDEIYLKALPRDPHRGNLLLSQFSGKIDKY